MLDEVATQCKQIAAEITTNDEITIVNIRNDYRLLYLESMKMLLESRSFLVPVMAGIQQNLSNYLSTTPTASVDDIADALIKLALVQDEDVSKSDAIRSLLICETLCVSMGGAFGTVGSTEFYQRTINLRLRRIDAFLQNYLRG